MVDLYETNRTDAEIIADQKRDQAELERRKAESRRQFQKSRISSEWSDAAMMAEALALGEAARGSTAPNPNVGCVIALDGEIIGRGATAPGGRPHAEAVAWSRQAKSPRRHALRDAGAPRSCQ